MLITPSSYLAGFFQGGHSTTRPADYSVTLSHSFPCHAFCKDFHCLSRHSWWSRLPPVCLSTLITLTVCSKPDANRLQKKSCQQLLSSKNLFHLLFYLFKKMGSQKNLTLMIQPLNLVYFSMFTFHIFYELASYSHRRQSSAFIMHLEVNGSTENSHFTC